MTLREKWNSMEQAKRLKITRGLKLLAAVVAVIVAMNLLGCANYPAMYNQYLAGCQNPANTKTISVPIAGTSQNLQINQGCSLVPPVDSDAKWVNAGSNLLGSGINAAVGVIQSNNSKDVQIQQNQSDEVIFTKAFEAAGNKVDGAGGDVVIGNQNGVSKPIQLPPAAPAATPAPAP